MIALSTVLTSCDSDLPKATEITNMRVVGAKLQVVTDDPDETRATPKPGEHVRVSLATVFPSLATSHRFVHAALISCTAPDRYTGGIPVCQELIDLATSGQNIEDSPLADMTMIPPCTDPMHYELGAVSASCAVGEQPVAEFPVPEDYTRDRLLFIGIVCEKGAAVIDPTSPQLFECEDKDAKAVHVHGLIPVQQKDAEENHNPEIGPDAFRIERELTGKWNPVDPELLNADTEADCVNASRNLTDEAELPLLYGHIDFHLIYSADAREQFEGAPESLEITLYTTAGEVERRFTLFNPEDKPDKAHQEAHELSSTLRYTPPKADTIPDNGKLVRFFATVRDQRGGFAITQYALCLGP